MLKSNRQFFRLNSYLTRKHKGMAFWASVLGVSGGFRTVFPRMPAALVNHTPIRTLVTVVRPTSTFSLGLKTQTIGATNLGQTIPFLKYFSGLVRPVRNQLSPSAVKRPSFFRLYSTPEKNEAGKQIPLPGKGEGKIAKMYSHAKDFLIQLWMATKLFWADTKAASSILVRLLEGHQLMRRERQLLVRAAGDVFKLVPLIVVIVVPFLELALPIILLRFPNILPSQFRGVLQKEEEKKKLLQAKLHVAQFLQDTMIEMSTDLGKRRVGSIKTQADEFHSFMEKIHRGEHVEVREIIHFSQLFRDEFTLDKLPREQLIALGQYLGVKPIGTDNFIRFQIRSKIRHIRRDDKEIKEEGINSLTLDELKEACGTRGMGVENASKAELRQKLSDWIDLSLNHNLPTSMLVMSQVFMANTTVNAADALKATVQSLPSELVSTLKEKISSETEPTENSATHYEDKLELLNQERKLIEEERKEAEMMLQAAAQGKELPPTTTIASMVTEEDIKQPNSTETIVEALSSLVRPESSVEQEKEMVEKLKKNQEELEASLNKSILDVVLDDKEWKSSDRLSKRLGKILVKLQKDLDTTAENIGDKLHVLDTNRDGVISKEELEGVISHLSKKYTPEEVSQVLKELDRDNDGKITLSDIDDTMDKLKGKDDEN